MKDSDAIHLLRFVWDNHSAETKHSWGRINIAMRSALQLAVGAGLTFTENDLAVVYSEFRGEYWMSDSDEWFYSQAIMEGNGSAVKEYERFKSRDPIIADGIDYPSWPSTYAHSSLGSKRGRLAVGFKFRWKGETVTVTSFNDEEKCLTACSYHGAIGRRKIKKRYRITRQMIIDERKAAKLKGGE